MGNALRRKRRSSRACPHSNVTLCVTADGIRKPNCRARHQRGMAPRGAVRRGTARRDPWHTQGLRDRSARLLGRSDHGLAGRIPAAADERRTAITAGWSIAAWHRTARRTPLLLGAEQRGLAPRGAASSRAGRGEGHHCAARYPCSSQQALLSRVGPLCLRQSTPSVSRASPGAIVHEKRLALLCVTSACVITSRREPHNH
jgi:hypothetical protein